MKSKKSYQCLLCTRENQSNSIVSDPINHLITAHPWKLGEIEKGRIPPRTYFILVSPQPDPPLSNFEFLISKKYWCDWNSINFGTNTFKIHVDGIVSIPIFCEGCIPEFNDIKQEFFKKLNDKSLFQFSGKGNMVLLDQSPDILTLIETIKVGIEIYPFKYNDSAYTTFVPLDKLSNKIIYDLYSEELNKTPYLKLLAKKHTNDYKLICLKEVWNHGKPENSFLFQIRSNTDCTTVIWENVNVGRATFVFKFRVDALNTDIDKIKEFIASNVVTNKRSELRKAIRSGMAFKEWGCLNFIEHRTIEQFENDVLKVLISKFPEERLGFKK